MTKELTLFKVKLLKTGFGNSSNDILNIKLETEKELYYYDDFGRWCYLLKKMYDIRTQCANDAGVECYFEINSDLKASFSEYGEYSADELRLIADTIDKVKAKYKEEFGEDYFE